MNSENGYSRKVGKLPSEVSRGTITFGGCEIEVVHLDNGQRIITAESFERWLRMMEDGGLDLKNITPAEGIEP